VPRKPIPTGTDLVAQANIEIVEIMKREGMGTSTIRDEAKGFL